MKLCYVLPQYFSNSAENFYHIPNFLEALGEQIDLYVVIENSDFKNIEIKNSKKTFVLNSIDQPKNILNRSIRLLGIFRKLNDEGVNIFFCRSSITSSFPLSFMNRVFFYNKKVLFWSCGQDVVKLGMKFNKQNLKRVISKIIFRLTLKQINYLVTGTNLMVDFYSKTFSISKKKILNLDNDISLNRFKPLPKKLMKNQKEELGLKDTSHILFVHTISKARGADLLIPLARKIKDKKLKTQIIVIGREGDFSEELKLQVKKNNLTENIIIFGRMPNKSIQKFYQVSQLFIMPSRGEGFPRVLLESMACGCAPLCFDVGGVRDILPKEILSDSIVKNNHDIEFINKTIELIQDHKKLQELSKHALNRVLKYSTENVCKQYLCALNKI